MASPRSPPTLPPEIVYSCEICGQDGFNDEDMRNHMEAVHLKGAVQCPFCDLSHEDVTPNEMTLHVNTAHLEYLTPEREDVCFLEDSRDLDDMEAIWQLEKGAKEGLTNGVTDPPLQRLASATTSTISSSCSSSSGGGPINSNHKTMDSPMSTSTDSPVHIPKSQQPQSNDSSGGAIQKRPRSVLNPATDSPSKSSLTLNVRSSYNNQKQQQQQRAPLATFGSSTQSASGSSSGSVLLTCPLCNYQHGDPRKLEEHVNRTHFDPASPAASGTTTASTAATASNGIQDNTTPSSLPCPLCNMYYATSLELERHVNRDHSDVLSPIITKRRPSLRDLVPASPTLSSTSSSSSVKPSASSVTGDDNGNRLECPVCFLAFSNQNKLAEHIDTHFPDDRSSTSGGGHSSSQPPMASKLLSRLGSGDGHSISSMASTASSSSSASSSSHHNHNQSRNNDFLLAQELERRERERRKHEEQREFDQLRAQFGMDNDGNFQQQSIFNMQNAVYRGEMSVVDYYERQTELKQAEKSGMDDGRSQTRHLMPKLKNFCQSSSGVTLTYLCSAVDHHSSSFGDKGWGCGYRNLQMLLSSLGHHPPFAEPLGLSKAAGTPSISKLQSEIEKAWARGYDVQGADQLGGHLVNTRKWIGATEIVAFLTANRVKTELLDFHKPTGKDGTHPRLYQWVLEYFRERAKTKTFTPPLYLQHQGHSRTIVGIEVLSTSGAAVNRDNNYRLLVFDPSHSRSNMMSLVKQPVTSEPVAQVMRMLRKAPSTIKSKQYQIVAVTGVFSEAEAANHKVIRSKRIP